MKYKCGPTKEEERTALSLWHSWFAWFPVRVGNGEGRWMEMVQRRMIYTGYGKAEGCDIRYKAKE